MIAPSYFQDFLSNIYLSENQINDLKTGHKTLRERLNKDEDLSEVIVSTFLQGSYKRNTVIKPHGNSRADVDIIVVTNLDKNKYAPNQALNIFEKFLDKHYSGKYRLQGRSIGITLGYVDLDLVVTSAPSEEGKSILKSMSELSEYTIEEMTALFHDSTSIPKSFKKNFTDLPQWKMEPLWIPDREAKQWVRTHPLKQIQWTLEKNKACNGRYIGIVKALKWWKKTKQPDMKQPKSYPFEHFIGQCCRDSIGSFAEGITLSLEHIVNNYKTKPFLPDHGVPEHDVFKSITEKEYEDFYHEVHQIAQIARNAFDEENFIASVNEWRKIFGDEFPSAIEDKSSGLGGFTTRNEKSDNIPRGRFA